MRCDLCLGRGVGGSEACQELVRGIGTRPLPPARRRLSRPFVCRRGARRKEPEQRPRAPPDDAGVQGKGGDDKRGDKGGTDCEARLVERTQDARQAAVASAAGDGQCCLYTRPMLLCVLAVSRGKASVLDDVLYIFTANEGTVLNAIHGEP